MDKKAVTTTELKRFKQEKKPIVMVTAYDYPSAKLVEASDADVLLVGDSLGMVVLGYDSTVRVTMEDMIHHTKAVNRAAKNTLVVTDMPFMSVQISVEEGVKNAGRMMQEAGAKAVKIEGGRERIPVISACVDAGIPVMGHIGLQPQSVHQLGGYKVQGKDYRTALRLVEDAEALEKAGVFAIVLECVSDELSEYISNRLSIPTIGIGSGNGCDGQVLVYHDLLQYGTERLPRFVRTYMNAQESMLRSLNAYAGDVRERSFPTGDESFAMDENVMNQIIRKFEENQDA